MPFRKSLPILHCGAFQRRHAGTRHATAVVDNREIFTLFITKFLLTRVFPLYSSPCQPTTMARTRTKHETKLNRRVSTEEQAVAIIVLF